MGAFYGFSTILQGEEYNINVVSGCSVQGIEFLVELQTLKFIVSDLNGTVCFCRVMLPRNLLAVPYIAVVDGLEANVTVLAVPDILNARLYFTFDESNQNAREVTVGSKPFYTLLQRYDELVKAYYDLNATYTKLSGDYSSLNVSYYNLRGNYSDLQSSLNSLQTEYNLLNSSYNDLTARYAAVGAELSSVRLLMYVFLAATIVGVVVSLVSFRFGFSYYRKFGEQKKIVDSYGLSPLEVARALFELDVRKRGDKIEKFQEKYRVNIRPRASLEDIIESLRSKKDKKQT
jgi:hypothetical protein